MTLGEKIRYYREQLGITQGKLAELTGIHPVSIQKYETNKMQPQPTQIERIATALGISYNALNDIDNAGMRLETVGDIMGNTDSPLRFRYHTDYGGTWRR